MNAPLSAIVRELISAGVTGDDLVMAIERIEAAYIPARSKGAERTARWREKNSKRHSNVTSSQNVTTPSPLVPPLEVSPAPLPKTPPIIPPTIPDYPRAQDLETILRKAAGWEHQSAPSLFVTGPIEGLLAAGASLDADVLPIIRGRAPKMRRASSWAYFVEPIRDAWQARINAEATGPPVAEIVPFSRQPTFGASNGTAQNITGRHRKKQILGALVAEAYRREAGESGGSLHEVDADTA